MPDPKEYRRPSSIHDDMKKLIDEMANFSDHAEDMERAWKLRAERLEAWLRYYASNDPMARITIVAVLDTNRWPPQCESEHCALSAGHVGECGPKNRKETP